MSLESSNIRGFNVLGSTARPPLAKFRYKHPSTQGSLPYRPPQASPGSPRAFSQPPSFLPKASPWRFCSPSWRQDPATSLKMLPKTPSWSQHLPKYLSNTAQDSPQDHSKKTPTLKKTLKVMEGWSFLHFGHFCKDRTQNLGK